MEVYLSMDHESMDRKPNNKWKIVEAKKRAIAGWQKIDIRKAAYLMGEKGHAVVPGHLEGGMSAKCCAAMQVFMLDFDDGISFEKIRGECKKMGLPISFAYHTFSSSEE